MRSTNMVYGNPYLPSQKNGWKPRKRPQNDLGARFLFILAVLGLLLGAWLISHPESAKAKTIELRDCWTNEQCLRLYCGEEGMDYRRDFELTKLCHE